MAGKTGAGMLPPLCDCHKGIACDCFVGLSPFSPNFTPSFMAAILILLKELNVRRLRKATEATEAR